MKPKAIIWDMDGTLIDSEPLHAAALAEAMDVAGVDPVEDVHDQVLGLSADAVYNWLCRDHSLALPFPEWIVLKYSRYLARVGELRPIPGALELWSQACKAGIKQAVASNSDRMIVDANLAQIGITRPGLVTVSRNDVLCGKPNPEIYLRAAFLLEVEPSDAVVVEDSLIGAQAAVAAGMTTFLVAHASSAPFSGVQHVSSLYCILEKLVD